MNCLKSSKNDIFAGMTKNNSALGLNIGKILLSIGLISLSSYISFNIGPIPITAQTLIVLLVPFFLSTKETIIALTFYLLIGALGAPVFADGSAGLDKLLGNSGGYLIGFLIAASIVSYLNEKHNFNSISTILMATLAGTLIILIVGTLRLGTLKGASYE